MLIILHRIHHSNTALLHLLIYAYVFNNTYKVNVIKFGQLTNPLRAFASPYNTAQQYLSALLYLYYSMSNFVCLCVLCAYSGDVVRVRTPLTMCILYDSIEIYLAAMRREISMVT